MARTVYPNAEIPHLWAHRAMDAARNGNETFYFRGDTIYSYGSHFPIARHVVNKKGERAVLFTACGRSNTTAVHKGMVRHSIPPGIPVFCVVHPEEERYAKLAEGFTHRIEAAAENVYSPTGRFRLKGWEWLLELTANANAFAEFFGLKKRWPTPKQDEVEQLIAKLRASRGRAEARLEARAKKIEAARLAEDRERLERWVNGEQVTLLGWGHGVLPDRLRVSGDVIETSRGATFPAEHGRKAIAFIRSVLGKGYARNGRVIRLGHYSIDRIEPDGAVVAGCHRVEYSEVERIAALLGMQREEGR